MSHALLEAHGINIFRGEKLILSNLRFDFDKGEKIAVIGRNGVGKTTLLLALAGLTRYEGELLFQNKPCHHGKHQQQIGYVPQRSQVRWDLPLQSLDVVMSGTAGNPHFRGRAKNKERIELAYQALSEVGALPLAKRTINSLSGGQAQRVLIARSLVTSPDILLLDEPLVGLDTFALEQVVDVLDAKSQKGTLVIAAMHELDIVKSSFKRVIFIENKNSVIDGNPSEVLERLYRAEAVNK